MFDTLRYVKKLTAAGVSEKEAEAHAEAQAIAFSDLVINKLATKDDIKRLEYDIEGVKNDIDGVKNDIDGVKNDINGVKNDLAGVKSSLNNMKKEISDSLTIRLGSITCGGIVILVAFMSIFHFHS